MTAIEQAIKDAVEKGGYDLQIVGHDGLDRPNFRRGAEHVCEHEIFLDSAFWQALGKARGWKTDSCANCAGASCWFCSNLKDYKRCNEWQYQWHRFIDHLADGKDANSFFESL